MQILRVDNRTKKVFVLKETDQRVVYIPVDSVHRIDYERFKKFESECPKKMELIEFLKDQKLDNGRYALELYDSIIQVAEKDANTFVRLTKPEEADSDFEKRLQERKEKIEDVETNSNESLGEIVKDNPNYEFHYSDKSGKRKIWTGKGRMPVAIEDHIDDGGKLEDFAVPTK